MDREVTTDASGGALASQSIRPKPTSPAPLGDLGQTAFGDFLQSIGDGAHHHVAIQPRGSARKSRADPKDLADALAFALRYSGRTRVRDAAEMMAGIVAKRLVEHLERSGFVVMKKPPVVGAAALGRGSEER